MSPDHEDLATPVWEQAAISRESVAPWQRVPHQKPESGSSGFAPNWILLVVFEAFSSELLQTETTLISVTLVFFSFLIPQISRVWSGSAPEVWSEAALTIRLTTCLEINRGDIHKAVGSSCVQHLCMTQSVCARARPLLPVCTSVCNCVQ